MSIRKLKCSACGANLEVDSKLEVGFCQYCGSKFMLCERVNVDVKIDHEIDNKIMVANQFFQEGNFEKAEKIFKEILSYDVNCYQAWWGRYLCESYYSKYYGYTNRYGETSPSIKASIIRKNLEYAYYAIEKAPVEEANKYRKLIASDEEFLKSN